MEENSRVDRVGIKVYSGDCARLLHPVLCDIFT